MNGEQSWQRERERFVQAPDQGEASPSDTELRRRRGEFGPLAAEFAQLAAQLFSAGTAADVLDTISDAAARLVPQADLVSITLRTEEGGFATPVTTDELAFELDKAQYAAQEGPCVEATLEGGSGVAAESDLGMTEHWPKWGPAAAALGIRSVLGFGLMPASPHPRLGALNLYSRSTGALDEVDRDVGVLLAAHAAAALAAARSIEEADLRVQQLERALLSRDVIGQAKGMLMAQRGISAEEAFDIMRRASQSLNIKLALIAEAITSRRVEL